MFTATSEAGKSITGINGQFVFSQLLIDCLLRLKSTEMDKNELISSLNEEYDGNPAELVHLHEFQKNYSRDKALWWYTRQSFFYKTLNAALRKQNIDMIFLYRKYISDIHRQLQRHQSTCSVRVYRSQLMSSTEMDHLQQNMGQFISVNSFLSTTTDRQVADMYMATKVRQMDLEKVLFEIDADPKVVSTRPFADISQISHFGDELEVLFMLGSIFRVDSINRNDDQVWIIRMSLCGSDEHSLKPILDRMKKQNGTGETNLCTLGKLVWQMGKFDLSVKYYNRYVNELPDDDASLLTAYEDLANIASHQGDYDQSMEWRQKLENAKKSEMNMRMRARVCVRVGCGG